MKEKILEAREKLIREMEMEMMTSCINLIVFFLFFTFFATIEEFSSLHLIRLVSFNRNFFNLN
jgi:hypothetical protein